MTLVWDELLAGVYVRRAPAFLAHVRVVTAFTRGRVRRFAGDSLCGRVRADSFARSGIGADTRKCPKCLETLAAHNLSTIEDT